MINFYIGQMRAKFLLLKTVSRDDREKEEEREKGEREREREANCIVAAATSDRSG